MSNYQFLDEEQKHQLNEIYVTIVRKYKSNATESMYLNLPPRMTVQDAEVLAEFDLASRRSIIMENYNERVENINNNATRRGMSNSTIVLQQLERALVRKQEALERLDNIKDKLAKRIFTNNQKLALSIERQKSTSISRALRDFVAVSRMKLSVPYNTQTLIDTELYDAYLAWLLKYPPETAYAYVNHNAIFYINMGITKWQEILAELDTRANAS